MRTKKEVYKKDQKEIINKIIKIIGIEDKKQITLYELDNDLKIQNEIINLIPEIRKYFNFKNITGAIDPEKIKRPWLSIIKHILNHSVWENNCHLFKMMEELEVTSIISAISLII